jgi:hypothetical protein
MISAAWLTLVRSMPRFCRQDHAAEADDAPLRDVAVQRARQGAAGDEQQDGRGDEKRAADSHAGPASRARPSTAARTGPT